MAADIGSGYNKSLWRLSILEDVDLVANLGRQNPKIGHTTTVRQDVDLHKMLEAN